MQLLPPWYGQQAVEQRAIAVEMLGRSLAAEPLADREAIPKIPGSFQTEFESLIMSVEQMGTGYRNATADRSNQVDFLQSGSCTPQETKGKYGPPSPALQNQAIGQCVIGVEVNHLSDPRSVQELARSRCVLDISGPGSQILPMLAASTKTPDLEETW